MTRIATTTISGTIAADDDNDNSIAYAYFIKVSFVVKVCEKLHIKIDWNVLLPILSAVEMPIIIMCMPFFSSPFSLSVLSHIFPVIRFFAWLTFLFCTVHSMCNAVQFHVCHVNCAAATKLTHQIFNVTFCQRCSRSISRKYSFIVVDLPVATLAVVTVTEMALARQKAYSQFTLKMNTSSI